MASLLKYRMSIHSYMHEKCGFVCVRVPFKSHKCCYIAYTVLFLTLSLYTIF